MEPSTTSRALARCWRHARAAAAAGADPLPFCLDLAAGGGPADLRSALADLPPEWADHAVASIHTLLMPQPRRKALGAYFTPPPLAAHVLDRLREAGVDPGRRRVRDPASGGGGFLLPLARAAAAAHLGDGGSPEGIADAVRSRVSGRELDPGLAALSEALLRRMLRREFGADAGPDAFVTCGDGLAPDGAPLDAVVGNPPYGKLGREAQAARGAEFADVAGGQMNLYAMFVRRGLDALRPGGVLAFLLPMSFLGSPDYRRFRGRVLELADAVRLDAVEGRDDVFLDVTQDACLLVLRRRGEADGATPGSAPCGRVTPDGRSSEAGRAVVPAGGAPWHLPTATPPGARRLADYGYRCAVGHVVPHRHAAMLHASPAPGRYPLVWARAVREGGGFDAGGWGAPPGAAWASAVPQAGHVVRSPCVVVQRTSNRRQARRVNAAAVPDAFLAAHGGLVGENHAVLVIAGPSPAVPPAAMAALLNSAPVNERFNASSGTATVSARLLAELDLPDPAALPSLDGLSAAEADRAVARAYAAGAVGLPAA